MWYRDYTLVRQRLDELEQEARTRAAMSLLRGGTRSERHEPGFVRSAGAAGARWIGQQALALANRLDCGPRESDAYSAAYRIGAR